MAPVQPLRKVHLVNVPGADVTLRAFDGGKKIGAGKIGNNAHPHRTGAQSLGAPAFRRDSRFSALVWPAERRPPRRVRGGFSQMCLPKFHLFLRPLFTARTVGIQAGGNDPGFAEVMVEHNQAVVKADVAIGQFEVVDGAAREFRLGEIFQIVAPVTKTAAERKRQVNFIQQFIARHEASSSCHGLPNWSLAGARRPSST